MDQNMGLMDFRRDLTDVINRHGLDAATETSDYLLAEFLEKCLVAYSVAHKQARHDERIGMTQPDAADLEQDWLT